MPSLYVCPHGLGYLQCEDRACVRLIKTRSKYCAVHGHVVKEYQIKTNDPDHPIETTRRCISCKAEL